MTSRHILFPELAGDLSWEKLGLISAIAPPISWKAYSRAGARELLGELRQGKD
jgi:hypothetical protein